MNSESPIDEEDLRSAAVNSPGPNTSTESKPTRLLDLVRNEIRTRHYSLRTEDTYVHWIRRFIVSHDKRHPRDMGATEVGAFLTYLAAERGVAAATQNQAKSALLFLYGQALRIELPWLDEVVTGRTLTKLPVVLTPSEVRSLFLELSGVTGLIATFLYGTGMRLMEAVLTARASPFLCYPFAAGRL